MTNTIDTAQKNDAAVAIPRITPCAHKRCHRAGIVHLPILVYDHLDPTASRWGDEELAFDSGDRTGYLVRKRNTDPDLTSCLRKGVFYTNFSISAPKKSFFIKIAAWLS